MGGGRQSAVGDQRLAVGSWQLAVGGRRVALSTYPLWSHVIPSRSTPISSSCSMPCSMPSINITNSKELSKRKTIKSQESQKKQYNKKGKRKQKFQIGNKVLYYNAAKEKQWSKKLKEK